jgi:energy-converting hydrogenase Eha subunit C
MKTITWSWLWITLFAIIFLGGIGFVLQAFQPIDIFEKATAGFIGMMMIIGGGYGILVNLFGGDKADEICTWIYGILMALAGVAFFGTLIVGGIVSLVKVIF